MPIDYKFVKNCCMNIIANRIISGEDHGVNHDIMLEVDKNVHSEDIEFWKKIYKKLVGKKFGKI